MKKQINIDFRTSESVTAGHPDKLCDLISDSILDAYLEQDPFSYVACEVALTKDLVVIMGEISSNALVNIEKIVRDTICNVGYNKDCTSFNGETVEIIIKIKKQSPDIAIGVNGDDGAGDQGMMYGMACDETKNFLPASLFYAHELSKQIDTIRKKKILNYLKPDGKTQVTIEYENEKVKRIDNILISVQHSKEVALSKIKEDIYSEVICKVIPDNLIDENTSVLINPTGKFIVGGPDADTGLTGRKIIVDTYGGIGLHGGGAFSGKDPSKVDRSGAYMMRYIAKNIVASGIISKIEIGISYAIGKSAPISLYINTFGKKFNYNLSKKQIINMISDLFPLTPKSIISHLKLRQPIYKSITNYGHFGSMNCSWEKLDKVEEIRKYFNL